MFPLNFHYEDVSRQDPLLKPNHANVMEVPGSCEIRVVPNALLPFFIKVVVPTNTFKDFIFLNYISLYLIKPYK